MKLIISVILTLALVSCVPSKKRYGCPTNPNPEVGNQFIKRGLGK